MSPKRNRKARRNAALSLLLVVTSLAGLTAVTTGALFTDTATVAGTSFVTGTVDLTAGMKTVPLAMSNMAPGDSVTAALTVANSGTLAERYAMSIKTDDAASDALAAQLVYTVRTGVTTCTKAGFDATGTQVYTGALASQAGIKVIGDKATGNQTGDRTLNAGASEDLCMQVTLPIGTDNTFQNTSAKATMTFNSEQVVNNP
jgi:hypothetical protein